MLFHTNFRAERYMTDCLNREWAKEIVSADYVAGLRACNRTLTANITTLLLNTQIDALLDPSKEANGTLPLTKFPGKIYRFHGNQLIHFKTSSHLS